jgi:DNA repair protein RadC
MRSACECPTPLREKGNRSKRERGVMRARVGPLAREQVRAYVKPHRPRDAEPITLIGKPGSKCRPFLRIEKDEEKFAACNALADEIGPIDDPKKAFRIIEDAIGDEVNEVFGVMMLDLHLRLKGIAEIGRGEPTSVMAPLKPTLQMALIDGAHCIVLFHVHPSGVEAEPSDADRDTTDAFADACEVIELPLLDHVICAGDSRNRSYYSFAEAGDL